MIKNYIIAYYMKLTILLIVMLASFIEANYYTLYLYGGLDWESMASGKIQLRLGDWNTEDKVQTSAKLFNLGATYADEKWFVPVESMGIVSLFFLGEFSDLTPLKNFAEVLFLVSGYKIQYSNYWITPYIEHNLELHCVNFAVSETISAGIMVRYIAIGGYARIASDESLNSAGIRATIFFDVNALD